MSFKHNVIKAWFTFNILSWEDVYFLLLKVFREISSHHLLKTIFEFKAPGTCIAVRWSLKCSSSNKFLLSVWINFPTHFYYIHSYLCVSCWRYRKLTESLHVCFKNSLFAILIVITHFIHGYLHLPKCLFMYFCIDFFS